VTTLFTVPPGCCTVVVLTTVWSLPGLVTVLPLPAIVVTRVCVTTLVMTFPGLDAV